MDFGLFYFAGNSAGIDGYRLLLEGARFADTHGFTAVWTPERHFDQFGGPYPNPAVVGAAVAAVTERVEIRAGSVVAPLHHPLRVAEEWAVVDNLSRGRVGLSFASGWHTTDFALRPENYHGRKEILLESIEQIRGLWRGKPVTAVTGDGRSCEILSQPAPVRHDLPIWLTAAGNPDTFRAAGELGAGVLTHLLGQDLDDLAGKIAGYRAALSEEDGPGHVVLMLHTFLGTDRQRVKEIVRAPFSDYLRGSLDLLLRAAGEILPDLSADDLGEEDVDFLVAHGFERYFETGGLFGTVEDCLPLLEKVRAAGVDEVACLVDFIDDADTVLDGLELLDELRRRCQN